MTLTNDGSDRATLDPARRQTDGTAGREHVAESYSFANVVDADEAVFDRIDPDVK